MLKLFLFIIGGWLFYQGVRFGPFNRPNPEKMSTRSLLISAAMAAIGFLIVFLIGVPFIMDIAFS